MTAPEPHPTRHDESEHAMSELTISTSDGSLPSAAGAEDATTVGPGQLLARWADPSALVRIDTPRGGFSVWVDQVTLDHPVVLRTLGVSVALGTDRRTWDEHVAAVGAAGGSSALERIDHQDEVSFATAAECSGELAGPTWLGLGRDLRTFGIGFRGVGAGRLSERLWDWIAPQWNGTGVTLTEGGDGAVRYQWMVGRGISHHQQIVRRLRDGTLPVLDTDVVDGPLTYRVTTFVALERSPLTASDNTGTDFLLADGYSAGHMFTESQQHRFDQLRASYEPEQETVCVTRIRVRNDGTAPRYAFVTLPDPYVGDSHSPVDCTFDPVNGCAALAEDRVFAVCAVDGEPAGQVEVSRLVQPGQTMTVDIVIPHRPVSRARAAELGGRDLAVMEQEVVAYWNQRLAAAGRIEVPEQRISEMLSAGLLHLDLVTYGLEPEGTLAPTIGVYSPIGSESAPIIQYYDSVGRHDLARRSLGYFVDKQHEDGFMQNFGGYMLETEAALWSFGEHYRYTRDVDWVRDIRTPLEAAVGYILRNRADQLAGAQPHGLLVGKTADPEDPFAAYMLNGFAALGLSRVAEMMAEVDPVLSSRYRTEADRLREDVRASLAEAMAGSPVVPLGNGYWSRTAPPWAGHPGPVTIDRAPGARWHSHGSITIRDALLGPLWLITQEVLEPDEPVSTELLEYHADLLFENNAAFSQPYYSPHLLTHLRRGETKQFLAPYYAMLAGLADRQTYSFWEHYFHASPHKTHEEAWFLMQTRWMLYLEDGATLRLLPGVPRSWLRPGQRIELCGVRSHFGRIDLSLAVQADGSGVDVDLRLDADRLPGAVRLRLPHPDGPRTLRTDLVGATVEEESVLLTGPTDHLSAHLGWD